MVDISFFHSIATSMFWLSSRVSNFAYLRYKHMIVDINAAQDELEESYINTEIPASDKIALVFSFFLFLLLFLL